MLYMIRRYRADKSRCKRRAAPVLGADRTALACLLAAAGLALLLLCVLAASARADATCYATHTTGRLNIRDKPGGEVVGYLWPGDAVTVLDTADGWAHVEADIEAGEGYVSMDYLSDQPADSGTYTVTSDGRVRVRNSPDGSPTGHYLHDGDTVTVTGWLQGWARIETGWVDGQYLVRDP